MRLRTKLLAILALLAAITINAAQKSDPAKVMFEAAKKKEVVDGDLNAAIQQYKAHSETLSQERRECIRRDGAHRPGVGVQVEVNERLRLQAGGAQRSRKRHRERERNVFPQM